MGLLKNRIQILFSLVFLVYVGWWISFQHVVAKGTLSNEWWGDTYGAVAFIGAIFGLVVFRKWGGFKSTLGKALAFFSLGLLAQEAGQLIYSYYIVVDKIQIPYPSLGDVAYFGSTLLYISGAIFLARAAGVSISLKNLGYKIIAVGLPLVLLVVSFLILLHNHHYNTSKPITVFLDAGYPIGEALYISIALVAYFLSRKLLGGVLKAGILFVMFALVVQYISDFTFVYQSNRNTWVPGSYDDLFYLIAYYVMGLAMLNFYVIYKKLKNTKGSEAAQ
ncbi:MAG TPA: hypothetical protein VMR34_04265 [Candidatus Saccharimonadales bacterium]|nr:hypothetical protein [Candidatus Saccharimonadales bacterium]